MSSDSDSDYDYSWSRSPRSRRRSPSRSRSPKKERYPRSDDPEIDNFYRFVFREHYPYNKEDYEVPIPDPFSIEKKMNLNPVKYAFSKDSDIAMYELLEKYAEDKENGGLGYMWKDYTFRQTLTNVMSGLIHEITWQFIPAFLRAGADPNYNSQFNASPFEVFLDHLKNPHWESNLERYNEFYDTEIDNEYLIDLFLKYGADIENKPWLLPLQRLLRNAPISTLDKYLNGVEPKNLNRVDAFDKIKTRGETALKVILRHGARDNNQARVYLNTNFWVPIFRLNRGRRFVERDFSYDVDEDIWKLFELILSYGIYPGYNFTAYRTNSDLQKEIVSVYVKTLPLPLFSSAISTIFENNGDVSLLPSYLTIPPKPVKIDLVSLKKFSDEYVKNIE